MTGADLTVVVPMHNSHSTWATFIESAASGLTQGVKYVLVDDASTDETAELAETWSQTSTGVTLLRNEVNVGAWKSRNRALGQVRTRYVTFVDADDWYEPERMPHLLKAITDLGVDFVRTDHVRVTGFRRRWERVPHERRAICEPALSGIGDAGGGAAVDYPYLPAGIYDLDRVGELFTFDETLRTAADRPFFWRLHTKAKTFAVVDAPAYFYRKQPGSGSLTQRAGADLLDFIPAYRQVIEIAASTGLDSARRRAAYGAYRIVAFHLEHSSRLSKPLRHDLRMGAIDLLGSLGDEDVTPVLPLLGSARLSVLRRYKMLDSRGL